MYGLVPVRRYMYHESEAGYHGFLVVHGIIDHLYSVMTIMQVRQASSLLPSCLGRYQID
jgi:hypothetical protein